MRVLIAIILATMVLLGAFFVLYYIGWNDDADSRQSRRQRRENPVAWVKKLSPSRVTIEFAAIIEDNYLPGTIPNATEVEREL